LIQSSSGQVANCIHKVNKAVSAMEVIQRFFTTNERLQLLTRNYYSILFYNSEVWNIETLKETLKLYLLSVSANAIKFSLHYPKRLISYDNLHNLTNRATPSMFCNFSKSTIYQLSLMNGSI
jgi:ligand-binding SRPBCC domain-containing protein